MANISKVYLLDTPLEDDLKHTLYFVSSSAQHTYMEQNIQRTYTNVSYQRDTSTFRCPAHIDSIRTCNYMMYQNTAYSNKWFYCFIEKMTYVNDGMTDVEFKVDPIQTFMFDFETQPSFIEREHTNNDTIGANTFPENLETGDYVNQPFDKPDSEGYAPSLEINYLLGTQYIVVGTSDTKMDASAPAPEYNGVFSGLTYIAFPDFANARSYVNYVNANSTTDPIVTMFMCPPELFMYDGFNFVSYQGKFTYGFVPSHAGATEITHTSITKPTTIDSYSPRNQKLLCYPYQYLEINNNAGSSNIYQYEMFKGYGSSSSSTCDFSVIGAISTGCSIQLIPTNYNKTSSSDWNFTFNNYEESLDGAKLPTCGWNNDAYTNWLTQNAVNLGIGFIGNAIQIGGSVASGLAGNVGAIGGITGGITGIANNVASIYEHSRVPNTARGSQNQGDLAFAQKRSFNIYKKCIKAEYARIIDDFFDMFGYKTNRVKKPNYAHRANWWYTKTIDIYIKGDIPNEYMNEIKNAYNNGITYWRNPANFMNYSVSNGIV